TPQERQRVPHHLIDILEPHQHYSAGEFARRARRVVAGIERRHRLPILVGGSGLYLRAFLDGISPIPPASPQIRRLLRRRFDLEGLAALRAELAVLDPETARRLDPGDAQRTLRALEVSMTTGRPMSSWIAERPFGESPVAAVRIGLTLPRGILYDRIADRVRSMVRDGWVEEVEELLSRGLDFSLPAFQAIGYRQLAGYAVGEGSLEAVLPEIIRATRRFAKRQQTWYRKDSAITWFDAENPAQALSGVLAFLDRVLKRGANGHTDH
ncbi:MAG: tRNA (adenosine(37)-N6)-dimethylallyltransferase MiaA, partial [Thermoanaerobaculia bacterium]